jgi:integral membrane sensor domain MASE1
MSERTWWETLKTEGQELLNQVEELIRAGNVRRIVIKQQGRTIAEFPLLVGVVGAVVAPVLAAIGAVIALAKDCTIEVERVDKG